MARVLVGSVIGGGAATVALRPDLVTEWAKDKALQGLLTPRAYPSTAGNSREIQELYKLVEQLARDVASSKQGGVTIVQQGGGSRAGGAVTYTVAGLVACGVVYMVVFRGWRLTDFMYVTRRSLRQGLDSVRTGLEDMRGRLDHVKQALQEKIGVLMRKQDATMDKQREMQSQLNVVGEDVETIRSQVGQIHGLVLDVTSGLQEVGANQRHANQGIFILCKAVSELMQGHNIPSKRELIEYTQHPIWTADKLQGLESILVDISDSDANRRGNGMLLEGRRLNSQKALMDAGEPSEAAAGVHMQREQQQNGGSHGGPPGGYGVGPAPGGGGGGRGGMHQSDSFTFGGGGGGGLGRTSPTWGSGGGIIAGLGAPARPGFSDPW